MKKYFFATLYIIFFTDIIAQRAVTGENNKVNFGSSMSILGSNFNNNSTLSSYKIQVFISKDILEKKKLNFSLGFGFSNRVLAKNILDPFDYNDVRSLSNFNYTLTHKYIELPLGLA